MERLRKALNAAMMVVVPVAGLYMLFAVYAWRTGHPLF